MSDVMSRCVERLPTGQATWLLRLRVTDDLVRKGESYDNVDSPCAQVFSFEPLMMISCNPRRYVGGKCQLLVPFPCSDEQGFVNCTLIIPLFTYHLAGRMTSFTHCTTSGER